MNENNEKDFLQEGKTPEIFGESKSREQIKAEARAAKEAERTAAKEAAKLARTQRKAMPKEKRTDILVVSCILVGMVLVCVALLFVQMRIDAKNALFEPDDTRESYFLDSTAEENLQMEEDGISAGVYQAYYTKGGYLAVEMVLGNGVSFDQHLTAISVELRNGDSEEVIASGRTTDISEEFILTAGGTRNYTLYIKPEHITIHDDPLTTLSYTITADGKMVEGATTVATTTAASDTATTATSDATTTAATTTAA